MIIISIVLKSKGPESKGPESKRKKGSVTAFSQTVLYSLKNSSKDAAFVYI